MSSTASTSSGFSALWRILLPYLKGRGRWPYGRLVVCNLLRLTELTLSFTLPFVLQRLFDASYTHSPSTRNILALYSLLLLARHGVTFSLNIIFFTLINTAVKELRFKLIKQGHQVPYEIYSQWKLGDALSCLQRLRSSLSPCLRIIGLNGTTHLIAYGVGLTWIGKNLGLGYVTLMVTVSGLYLRLYWYVLGRYASARQLSWSYTDSIVQESMESLMASESVRPYFNVMTQRMKEFFVKEAAAWSTTMSWSYALNFLASTLCTLTVWILTDATLIGTASLFIVVHRLFNRTFQAFNELAYDAKSLKASLADFKKIADLLDQSPELAPSFPPKALEVPATLKIESLTFFYAHAPEPLLHNLSLSLPSPYKLLLTGPNGCGKSTLLKIISGLLKHQKGHIFWGSERLDGAHPQHLTPWIYRVPQDPIISPGTLETYLSLGLGVDKDLQWQALKLVNLDKTVKSWPKQLSTSLVSSRNTHLSGGQKQRLALARAWLAKPTLLLLDEATSAIDPEDSHTILTALWNQAPQVVCITHYPDSLPWYDGQLNLCSPFTTTSILSTPGISRSTSTID